jgi:hypothetical protein
VTVAVDPDALTRAWTRRWSSGPPVGALLRDRYPDRVLRVAALAGPARPAATEEDYRTLLTRHNTLLARLFGGREVYLVTAVATDVAEPATPPRALSRLNPGSVHWLRLLGRDEHGYRPGALDLYVGRQSWAPGRLDDLLCTVASGRAGGVLVMDTGLHRVYHPHAAGGDALLTGPAERTELALDYAGWCVAEPN